MVYIPFAARINLLPIIQLCKHVVAKVTLVPCSINLTGKRDKVGHGEVTCNNALIITSLLVKGNTKVFFFIIQFYVPFKNYLSSHETGQPVGGR